MSLLGLSSCGPGPADTSGSDDPGPELGDPDVIVDVGGVIGAVTPLTGVNRPPVVSSMDGQTTWDYTALYQAAGVTSVRLHDTVVDVCRIYQDDRLVIRGTSTTLDADACSFVPSGPDAAALWSANHPLQAGDSAHYDFTAADRVVDSVLAGGFDWLLRLGESYNGPNDTDTPLAWAEIAANIHRHYATGWPGAPNTSRAPAGVEIHNEPDAFFWRGTRDAFYGLYEATEERLDASALPRGGSGFTHDGVDAWLDAPNPSLTFVGGFLERIDPDVISVHHYGPCEDAHPSNLVDHLGRVRTALGDGPNLWLTEWNMGLGEDCGSDLYATGRSGAYVAASLAAMQDPALGIDGAWYYAGAPIMGLFSTDRDTGDFLLHPAAWAFAAHARLQGDLHAAESSHADVYAVADGTTVVLANYADSERLVEVRVGEAPSAWGLERAATTALSAVAIDEGGVWVPASVPDGFTTDEPAADGTRAQVRMAPWEVVVLTRSP